MTGHGYDIRPDIETLTLLGARVTVVDPAALLVAAGAGPVELLTDADFPAPVRDGSPCEPAPGTGGRCTISTRT